MRKHYDKDSADIKTKMNYNTIVSGEQQTMLFLPVARVHVS